MVALTALLTFVASDSIKPELIPAWGSEIVVNDVLADSVTGQMAYRVDDKIFRLSKDGSSWRVFDSSIKENYQGPLGVFGNSKISQDFTYSNRQFRKKGFFERDSAGRIITSGVIQLVRGDGQVGMLEHILTQGKYIFSCDARPREAVYIHREGISKPIAEILGQEEVLKNAHWLIIGNPFEEHFIYKVTMGEFGAFTSGVVREKEVILKNYYLYDIDAAGILGSPSQDTNEKLEGTSFGLTYYDLSSGKKIWASNKHRGKFWNNFVLADTTVGEHRLSLMDRSSGQVLNENIFPNSEIKYVHQVHILDGVIVTTKIRKDGIHIMGWRLSSSR